MCWVRCLLSTGKPCRLRKRKRKSFHRLPVPFGSSALTTSACSALRSLTQIQISSPYQLSSAYPVVVTRRVRLSRIVPLAYYAISYIVRAAPLFMPLDSSGSTDGSLPKARTTTQSDFVSHLSKADMSQTTSKIAFKAPCVLSKGCSVAALYHRRSQCWCSGAQTDSPQDP